MARITTIMNQKGGVGKTTTAHTLATGLNLRGYHCLVVDADPQGNISFAMQADTQRPGLYEAMRGEAAAGEAIQQTKQGDIIASSLDVQTLSVSVNGAGDAKLSGQAQSAYFSVNGAGDIDARGLECENVSVHKAGIASIQLK